MRNMIVVDNLSVSYGRKMPYIINNMSFKLIKGEILNILGQNAVGKTTLIRALTKEILDYEGSIKVAGEEIKNYSIIDYAKLIGVVSTANITFQNLIVADYLLTGAANYISQFSKPNDSYLKKAYDILVNFGKEELFNKHIDQLSSGEKQIVMISRVLLQNPKVIIFDEPTANLDVKNQLTVLNLIKKLSLQGYTIIVTTHNPGHAYSLGNKTLIMGKKKYRFGDTYDIISDNVLSEYYELNAKIHLTGKEQYITFKGIDTDTDLTLRF